MQQRFEMTCLFAGKLIQMGIFAFSPIAHNIPILKAANLNAGWDTWKLFDTTMLLQSERVMVLCLPGWELSKGISAEIKTAEDAGIPVEYVHFDDF